MRELGRQREIAFRKVGEGTGAKRDLDRFDLYYRHLILWDKHNLAIVGAYRLGRANRLWPPGGGGFYTRQMYQFNPEYRTYLLDSGIRPQFCTPGLLGQGLFGLFMAGHRRLFKSLPGALFNWPGQHERTLPG